MEQNSPSIARPRAPFARIAQAFPISPTSKTSIIARVDWDPFADAITNSRLAMDLRAARTKTAKAKFFGARDSEGFAQTVPRTECKTIVQGSPPGFSTPIAYDSGDHRLRNQPIA
jgi:hypothetical protein